ncbi:MAG: hypothetical protein OXE85_13095, partial [Roseovarius sp.]|nr:hypothetical protein [Roseovarius sp.]
LEVLDANGKALAGHGLPPGKRAIKAVALLTITDLEQVQIRASRINSKRTIISVKKHLYSVPVNQSLALFLSKRSFLQVHAPWYLFYAKPRIDYASLGRHIDHSPPNISISITAKSSEHCHDIDYDFYQPD